MQQMDTPTGLQAPLAPDELRHESKVVGALPIINHFLLLLGLNERLQRFLPGADPHGLLPPAVGLGVLLRNMLAAVQPAGVVPSLRLLCRHSAITRQKQNIPI
jgi:hypothetical protein